MWPPNQITQIHLIMLSHIQLKCKFVSSRDKKLLHISMGNVTLVQQRDLYITAPFHISILSVYHLWNRELIWTNMSCGQIMKYRKANKNVWYLLFIFRRLWIIEKKLQSFHRKTCPPIPQLQAIFNFCMLQPCEERLGILTISYIVWFVWY